MKNFVYKLGLLAILVSPIAPAAIITQDVAIQNNAFASDRATFPDSSLRADNGRYKNIGFDRFDSSLGELLNVSITYASTLNHRTYGYSSDSKDNSFDYVDSGWVYNSSIQDYYRFYGEDAAIDAFGYASTSLRLINPISYTNAISDRNTNADCRVNKRTGLAYYYSGYSNLSLYGNATCSKTENDNTNFSGSLNLSGINLNLFTSDYSASMLNLQSYTRAYVSATCDRDSGQYCYASNRVTLNGTATVTYEYKAVAVPEPSILALMGLGIFALGLSRRNIKK